MQTYTITRLARLFGLSRSTLLYYDRIGLLVPSYRTSSGYRVYVEDDVKCLERICSLRQTGLSLDDIRTILASEDEPNARLIEDRMNEIGDEILVLQARRRLLSSMLRGLTPHEGHAEVNNVNKQMWIEMLRVAGMDEEAMDRWHAEFEQRAPEAHQAFLLSLGIPAKEVRLIRRWSRRNRCSGGEEARARAAP